MWKPIKPAEMQKYDIAYPIGYFSDTTERGEYTIILNSISNQVGTVAEVLFQFVDQDGVLARIWKYTREQAEKLYPDPATKEHKRIEFSYAPSALVVYIAEKKDLKVHVEFLLPNMARYKIIIGHK